MGARWVRRQHTAHSEAHSAFGRGCAVAELAACNPLQRPPIGAPRRASSRCGGSSCSLRVSLGCSRAIGGSSTRPWRSRSATTPSCASGCACGARSGSCCSGGARRWRAGSSSARSPAHVARAALSARRSPGVLRVAQARRAPRAAGDDGGTLFRAWASSAVGARLGHAVERVGGRVRGRVAALAPFSGGVAGGCSLLRVARSRACSGDHFPSDVFAGRWSASRARTGCRGGCRVGSHPPTS